MARESMTVTVTAKQRSTILLALHCRRGDLMKDIEYLQPRAKTGEDLAIKTLHGAVDALREVDAVLRLLEDYSIDLS